MGVFRKFRRKQEIPGSKPSLDGRIGLEMKEVKRLHKKLYGSSISREVPNTTKLKVGFLSDITQLRHRLEREIKALEGQHYAEVGSKKERRRFVKRLLNRLFGHPEVTTNNA
ncbi:MAG: hypothetical protein M0Z67_10065 [Nitrospiraceae bacterium]|nr:hypothetical protein [Nitrospiraceae bacterium]